jgi:uncharacterized protein with PIN domain
MLNHKFIELLETLGFNNGIVNSKLIQALKDELREEVERIACEHRVCPQCGNEIRSVQGEQISNTTYRYTYRCNICNYERSIDRNGN